MFNSVRKRILGLTEPAGHPEEVADGVFETRRRLLWMPFAGAAMLIANRLPGLAQTGSPKVSSAWDLFLKECLPTAVELHAGGSRAGQERYLRWIGYAAANLKLEDLPTAKLGRFKTLEPPLFFGVGYRGKPFFVVEWRMEPNAYLPPHNHPNVSVCSVGLEGEAVIRKSETIGQPPEFGSTKAFQVRENSRELIAPGRINTLSAFRDNIHTFRAGKQGARGIDITTYHGENIGFSDMEIDDKPVAGEQQVFQAVWKKL